MRMRTPRTTLSPRGRNRARWRQIALALAEVSERGQCRGGRRPWPSRMLTTPSPRIATSPRRTLGNLVAFLVVWGDVPGKSTAPYLFGDLLALARQSWVRQMAGRLNQLGYQIGRASCRERG